MIGGHERQYVVAPRPTALLAFGLTLADLATALERNNVERRRRLHRALRQPISRARAGPGRVARRRCARFASRRTTARRSSSATSPRSSIGKDLRTGAATMNGEEVVLGTVFMLMGENSRIVARAAADEARRDQRVAAGRPAARSRLRPHDAGRQNHRAPCARTSFEGALLVDRRAVRAARQPARGARDDARDSARRCCSRSRAWSRARISGNLMSLGALDFGLIVDGAVIIVENCLRRLGAAQRAAAAPLPLRAAARRSCAPRRPR